MSGIFNGNSIYKSGGGGGGYKDGGQLIDGDFIKVDNNTVSTYENTSRTDINYYFEYKDGDILNAVIELTNNVNATVHVYILQNGFYYPLGNVGGDTVNPGEEYKINITGDSFSIEQVTPAASVPEYVSLMGTTYKMIKNGSLYWMAENYKSNGSEWFRPDVNKNININGWRMPAVGEIQSLRTGSITTGMCSVDGWSGTPGTNTNGFNLKPLGRKREDSDNPAEVGVNAYLCCTIAGEPAYIGIRPVDYVSSSQYITIPFAYTFNIRLCKDA